MAVSQSHIFLWSAGVIFVILPHINQGLLSDYKICRDSACESLLSRVQAIRDYHGKDCRFLSFRHGETIFVYHKLTGKRDDLWAGSIDKQFGYFPKDAVKEEEVYATTEKVVETQKSDFFCMDENGYPIDSSDLDNGDDDEQGIQNQKSETTQTSPDINDNNAKGPSTSKDPTTESPLSANEVDSTFVENDKPHEEEDPGDGDQTHVAQDEQGGSLPSSTSPPSSSSWFDSSVTGWLGLAEEGEPADLAEGEQKDESETKNKKQPEASFTSSVTGWLGMGGEGNLDITNDGMEKDEEKGEEVRETDDSFTSTVTGWFGFGGDKRTDDPKEREPDEEEEVKEEEEKGETFRIRRLALDLESNQLQDEDRKETGTLDWLGSGLSSALGFGQGNQELGPEETASRGEAEETTQEVEPPPSRSWLDIGIGDVLGFGKDKGGSDDTAGIAAEEREEDKNLEQPAGLQNVDTSEFGHSQPALKEEGKTEPSKEEREEKLETEAEAVTKGVDASISSSSSKDPSESEVKGTQKDKIPPSEIETESGTTLSVAADDGDDVLDILENSKDDTLTIDTRSEEAGHKETELEKESQSVFSIGGLSSMLDNFLQVDDDEDDDLELKDEETSVVDDERSVKNKNEVDEVSTEKSAENKDEEENHSKQKSTGDEKSPFETVRDVNQDFITRNDSNQGSTLNSTLDSMVYSVGESEEDEPQSKETETTDVEESHIFTKQIDKTEDFTDSSVKIKASGDADENEGSKTETGLPHREAAGDEAFFTKPGEEPQQSQVGDDEEDRSGKSLPSSQLGATEERNGKIPREDTILAPHSTKSDVDDTDRADIFDNGTAGTGETLMKQEQITSGGEADKTIQEMEPPLSHSWLDEGIGDVSCPRKDNVESDKTTGSGFTEREEDKSLEQPTGLQNVAITQSGQLQPAVTEEGKTEPSKEGREEEVETETVIKGVEASNASSRIRDPSKSEVAETQKDQNLPSEIKTEPGTTVSATADGNDDDILDILDNSKDDVLTIDTGSEEDGHKETEIRTGPGTTVSAAADGNDDTLDILDSNKEEEDTAAENIKTSDMAAMFDNSTAGADEASMKLEVYTTQEETHHAVLGQEGESNPVESPHRSRSQEFGTSQFNNVNNVILHENTSEKDRDRLASSGMTPNQDIIDQSFMSPKLSEKEGEDVENENGGEEKEERLDESGQASVISSLSADSTREASVTGGSNEVYPQDATDGSLISNKEQEGEQEDSKDGLGSADETAEETGKHNLTDDDGQISAETRGESQKTSTEGMEAKSEMMRIQDEEEREKEKEEKTSNEDSESDEVKEERTEEWLGRQNSEPTVSGEVESLVADQTGKVEHRDNDLPHSDETRHHRLSDDIVLNQTAEHREDQLYSGETKQLSNDIVLGQRNKTELTDNDLKYSDETAQKIKQRHSDHQIDTTEDRTTDEEDEKRSLSYDDTSVNEGVDRLMMSNDGDGINNPESASKAEREVDISDSSSEIAESQSVPSEQAGSDESNDRTGSSVASEDQNGGTVMTKSGGAFGLFKNAFSYFSPTPSTESEEAKESAASSEQRTEEVSQPQASLTPEQEADSNTDSTQVHIQDFQPNTAASQSQEQPQPSPPFSETQTSTPSPTDSHFHPHSPSPTTEAPFKTTAGTLAKHYKKLLAHMSVDETTIVIELFGQHKLQWLNYILDISEAEIEDPGNDESILSDMERLLHHHREMLMSPSVRLTDAPQEDKKKTSTLIAFQKLDMLLARVKEILNTGKSDVSNTDHQGLDNKTLNEEVMGEEKQKDGQQGGLVEKERETERGKRGEIQKRSEEERPVIEVSSPDHGGPQPLEGVQILQILESIRQIAGDATTHILAVRELLKWLIVQVVSSLPDDIRPGPDLYGLPWEPIIISGLVGLVTMLVFSCRCYSSVKSRLYRSKERRLAEQVAELLNEKCKVLETLSTCQQEYDDLENSLRDSGVLAQTEKTERLEVKARQLERAKGDLERDLEQLKDQLDQQREHRIQQEKRIAELEESMKTCEEETKQFQSQEEQAHTTLKVYSMNSDRLHRNLESAEEENTLLQESNSQLRQQTEGWVERVSELEEEMRRCEVSYTGMLQDVANKDERIKSLTDRLLSMKAWDSDLEEEAGGEEGERESSNGTAAGGGENGRRDTTDTQHHLQKVQKLICAAKLNADLKSVDEDKDRVFAKLNDEVRAKEDLQEGMRELEREKLSLQSEAECYRDQVQRLQQKLQIMTEMYQENELKLHRLLTVEEKERLQKEEKLSKADRNITLAMEELNNYRQRAEEMEEELEKTKQSYQTQISAHEKKAHNNWLAARAADRELADIRRENALLRQKLTDTQFKLDALDKDPYALDSLARPLPFRGERSPYGPSPLGRPASETRAFLSPPTLMEGPPPRLSPRMSRGPVEPPGGQGELERGGGPHSDSGSISPTWERDRRGPPGPPGPPGPLGPPGYMFPEPGGPMYRRPAPPPGALGVLPPPGPLPPRGLPPPGPPGPPLPPDMAEATYGANSLGPAEHQHREVGPGDRRTPPEADRRMGDVPPLGPPMGPMDGPFPRRPPYGPPPPDFYPPRGPVGPPMMPMWAPPPHPGMMFPPRFPPGGAPPPHPHSYGPPMRPPPPDGFPPPSMGPPPPRQPLPSPTHSQSPDDPPPSPHDAI